MKPPSWVLISGLLKMMEKQFAMKPSLGAASSALHAERKPVSKHNYHPNTLTRCKGSHDMLQDEFCMIRIMWSLLIC